MQQSRFSLRKLGRSVALPLGLLLAAFSGQAHATTAADVCATPGNTCAGGVANINVRTDVTDGSVLDFVAAGFPTVNVNSGGRLHIEPIRVGTAGLSCPAKPSVTMEILVGDLTVNSGGKIDGDYTGANTPSGTVNGGAIYIQAENNVIVAPGGSITSDRAKNGNGRGGNITIATGGILDVQADPSGTPRGIISANTQAASRAAFLDNCGLSEITLVATGNGGSPAIRIAGTVEIVYPPGSVEGVVGGIITLLGGGDTSNITVPPFPTAAPITRPNPPDNSATVLVTATGLINTDAKDSGGGIIRISACFVTINGLVQAGGNAHTGIILGKEGQGALGLPVIIEVIANENAVVQPLAATVPGIADPGVADPPGGIRADLRLGFKQHVGQGITDASQGLGTGCVFVVQSPPNANKSIAASGKGGADVCLTARANLTVDGTALATEFAVRARTGFSGGSQVGGTVLALSTAEDEIDLINKAINVDGVGNGSSGGEVVCQAQEDVVVSGRVEADRSGGTAVGGSIDCQAIDGAVTMATGVFSANPSGIITLTECVVNAADDPQAIPGYTSKSASCGTAKLVTAVPSLLPCQGGCFCLEKISVRNGVLTIRGAGLKGVDRVEFHTDCNPTNSGGVVKANFTSVSDTKITLTLPAPFSGQHVVLTNPIGPSSSCSQELLP